MKYETGGRLIEFTKRVMKRVMDDHINGKIGRGDIPRVAALYAAEETPRFLADVAAGKVPDDWTPTYTCEACGETYEKTWSDEEAMAEADALFGDALGSDPAIVCDDCWRKMVGVGEA